MTVRATMPELTRYTFGSMSLGHSIERTAEDVAVARQAMEAGVWFHTSQEYSGGDCFRVLRHAFDEAPGQRPPLIVKVRCDDARVLRFDVEDVMRRLGVERVDLAQLCRARHDARPIVDDFLAGGPMHEVCCALRDEGKVGNFTFEVFTGFSQDATRALENELFDAYTFYYSLVNREGDNRFHRALEAKGAPVLALRTVGGGLVFPERAKRRAEKRPDDPDLQLRRRIEPIVEQHGGDWFDLNFRFILSTPNVVTTIGGTASSDHLKRYIEAAEGFEPLEASVVEEIRQVQADALADRNGSA